MMDDRIALKLIGITYNQIESGVYALILQEEDGDRRLPIVIGYPEAQAIECKMQEVATPRPLTHDLFINCINQFGMELLEIRIHRLPNGVFAADMVFQGPRGNLEVVDARSSDAIALAIRAGAPIFTSEQLMSEVGFTPGKEHGNKDSLASRPAPRRSSAQSPLAARSTETLEKELAKAVENEDYEKAGEIKKELDKRNGSQQ